MTTNGQSFVQKVVDNPEISVAVADGLAVATAAAIVGAVWAFKGKGAAVAERAASMSKGDAALPFIGLGGDESALAHAAGLEGSTTKVLAGTHPGDLPIEQALDAHAAGWVFMEPEDAGFARALAMAMEHDIRLGRMAVSSVGGHVSPEEAERFSNLSRLAAERGRQIGAA